MCERAVYEFIFHMLSKMKKNNVVGQKDCRCHAIATCVCNTLQHKHPELPHSSATLWPPWSRGKTCPCCPREFAVLATFACQMLQAKSWQIQQSQQQHQLSASVFKAMNWSTSCKALAILRFHYLRPVLYKAFTNYVNFKEIKQFSPSF